MDKHVAESTLQAKDTSWRTRLRVLAWLLSIALISYMVGAGPVWLGYRKDPTARRTVVALYYPLGWLREHSETARNLTDWYFKHVWHYGDDLMKPSR